MTADSAAVIIDTSHAIKDANELETQVIDRGGSSRAAAALLARMKMQQDDEDESDSIFGDEDEKPQVVGEDVISDGGKSDEDKDEQHLDLAANSAKNEQSNSSDEEGFVDEGLMRPIFLGKRDREVLNADNVKVIDNNQEQELEKLEQDID